MDGFRFSWRRRKDWSFEAYDAYVDEFKVAHVLQDKSGGLQDARRYTWQVSVFYMPPGEVCPHGRASTPREAATMAEASFGANLPRIHGFHLRQERAIELCRMLGIELPPQTRWQAQKFGLIALPDPSVLASSR